MKVRHMQTGEIEEVEGKFSLSTGVCYLQKVRGGISFDALYETEYEPFPDDHWVDVTEECHVSTNLVNLVHEQYGRFTGIDVRWPDGKYRLVKERFFGGQYGFRVERKESA